MIIRVPSLRVGALTALLIVSTQAPAAVVNGVFTINNAVLTDLYSDSLDNGANGALPNPTCTALAGAALQECQFFGGVPAAPRAISITNNGYNAGLQFGTLNVQYDNATGEITQVNALRIYLQDLTVNIGGGNPVGTTVQIINGNGMGVTGCFLGTCTPAVSPNDQTTMLAGTFGVNGTVDPDQAPAIGQAGIFQHSNLGFTDVPDFSNFQNVTDSCTPGSTFAFCNLIAALNIDGNKYLIQGTVNSLGGDALTLRAQTPNTSIYTVTLNTAVVPAPPAVWLLLTGVGALVARRFRRQ